MKKSFVLTVVGFVLFAIGVAIIAIAEKNSIVLPVWATVVSCGLTIAAGVLAVCSNYVDKQVPNRKSLMVIFTMFPIMAVMYALRYADVVSDEVAGYTLIAVLIIGSFLAFHFDENYRLKKKAEPADNADADETTQPLPDVDDNDVTVVSGEEAVVVEDDSIEFPQRATLLVLDENGNPELDEDGKLQFYDDEGHRIYGVSALGTVTKITDDSIVITKEDGNTITVHSNGSVEGDIPDSLYVPRPDNKEGWRNVYQGIRERLEEDPFKK